MAFSTLSCPLSPHLHNPQFSSKPSAKTPSFNQLESHLKPSKTLISSYSSISKPYTTRPIISPSKGLISISSLHCTSSETVSHESTEEVEDEGSPWEGAVVYKRDSSVTHLEYCTTLERLGLGKLSSDVSNSRASSMGIRVTKGVTEYSSGTPVQISIDVYRRKQDIKLDGILKTVITLACNRCAEPAAECVFSDFTLLLTDEPINEENDEMNFGVLYGDDKWRSYKNVGVGEEEAREEVIDLDDRLYFPLEEREIDISKHIRDAVHVEITIDAICDANCRGLCLECGVNLNKSRCGCGRKKNEKRERESSPLSGLKHQTYKQ
ncbi:hypothetical protein AMTRI_Chr09g13300 [Amborella trichopoda]|uniref:Large ribosomal RNA subunit accumulation protein YceD n=1 Tax=Amborella trichopoda TaxID=13333 RepID=W1PP23_AMBTC|nr:large ribosomal RNA subunit accumulation protein YCED homolog 1, chloroplastic [Amborella trichopoda]ERN09559.1 hypothetical protein AMTR_s00029p00159160 [Amborella trichopoda]|eukprot:XP_006847978.1 large ribosomal RNA subunit accumulation protein YCED homolog 1, chloroplastic [Amborella trichopoda]